MMTVSELKEQYSLTAFALPEPDRKVQNGYIGDLLSWVMGKAQQNNVWITIMSNLNTVAVASLTDVSAILFAEGVIPDQTLIETANAKGVNLLGSTLSAFQLAVLLGKDVS